MDGGLHESMVDHIATSFIIPLFRAFNDQIVSEDVAQKLNQSVVDAIGKQVAPTYFKDLKAVWNMLTCHYN
jgi:hypothetical protein